jgi:hypothetical protein
MRSFVGGQPFSVLVDESEGLLHRPVHCVLINTPDGCILGNVLQPPPEQQNGAEAVVKAVKETLALLNLKTKDMQALATDNAPYCGKAFRLMKAENGALLWIRCLAHGLNLVLRALCSPFEAVGGLIADLKSFFCKGFGLRRRICDFEKHFAQSPLGVFDVTDTRWSEWVRAVQWASSSSTKLASWIKNNESQSSTKARIEAFLTDTASVAGLHVAAACTTELMQLIVDAQGDPLSFLTGERGNLYLRFDAQRKFILCLQDPEFARRFIRSSFLAHREEPGGSNFDSQFEKLEKEEMDKVFVMASQGAIPACAKYDKHITDTLNSLRAARYIVPQVACTLLGEIGNTMGPPDEVCSSVQCTAVDATLMDDWTIYVSKELPAFRDLADEDRPTAVDFWKSKNKSLPRLAAFALKLLSLPLGTAAAERAFAKLRDVQTSHRGSIGELYTKMELILSFNAEIL